MCFLINTDDVRDGKITLNVFFNIFILYYLKFERNNVSVLISDPPLSPMLQFCLLCGLFCVGLFLVLVFSNHLKKFPYKLSLNIYSLHKQKMD